MECCKCMHLLYKTHIICKRGSHIHIQPVLPAHFQNAGLEKKQFSLPSLFQATVRIHIWLERWWKKRRRTMTCLLHIRTTTAASPNTKRKERNEDLEEQNTVVYYQIQNKSYYSDNEQTWDLFSYYSLILANFSLVVFPFSSRYSLYSKIHIDPTFFNGLSILRPMGSDTACMV